MKENMDVRVSTHLYKFEKEQLDRIIKEKNIPTISQFIRELIREYLEKEKCGNIDGRDSQGSR